LPYPQETFSGRLVPYWGAYNGSHDAIHETEDFSEKTCQAFSLGS
jgi:hypothetical protein